MIITRLEPVTKYKTKVYVDDEFAFSLSNREIFMHGIKEEGFLSEADYKEIVAEAIKKAKVKAMDVLKQMERTEHELRTKLKQDGYAENQVEEAIAYVESFHYIDDVRYTVGYIQARKSSKSKMQIKMGLMKKGISDDIIRQAYDEISELYQESEEDAEIEAIRKHVARKSKNVDSMTKEERMKLIGSLYRKGFKMDQIRKVVDEEIEF